MSANDSKPADEQPEGRKVECPQCGCRHCLVVYTILLPRGRVRRRHECRHCGKMFSTTEGVGQGPKHA